MKDDGICVDGHGIIEVKVGTTAESCCPLTMIANRAENMALTVRRSSVTSLITLPPAYSQLSSRSGSVYSLETRKLTLLWQLKFFSSKIFLFNMKNLLATMIYTKAYAL